MKKYKGFEYYNIGDGKCKIVFPSGFKVIKKLSSEKKIKGLIASLIARSKEKQQRSFNKGQKK